MDLFQTIRELPGVEKLSNFFPADSFSLKLKLVFFLCPKMKSSGFQLNTYKTGLKAAYDTGLSNSTIERLKKVESFVQAARSRGIKLDITAIWANADPLILFPSGRTCICPSMEESLGPWVDLVVNNYDMVRKEMDAFWTFYEDEPWKSVPGRFVEMEEQRLRTMLVSAKAPPNIKDDFVRRAFAGFALDGYLLSNAYRQYFGSSVILGVESPGVAVLQNAALSKTARIPVIQLK